MRIALSVSEKEKAKGTGSPYFKAMVAAGTRPQELALITAADRNARKEAFDGVLFAGGEDVDPQLYDEKKKYENVQVNRARDDFELALLDRAGPSDRRPGCSLSASRSSLPRRALRGPRSCRRFAGLPNGKSKPACPIPCAWNGR